MQYKHTQVGIVTLAVFGIITALLVFASMSKPEEPIGFVFIVLAIASVLFSTLTVKVDDTNIRWFFGPNFWSKSMPLSKVMSVKKVRTKWYYGFGIRLISTGWLYNVSGLTAVELKLTDGTTVSLGTDDADSLVAVIESHLNNETKPLQAFG